MPGSADATRRGSTSGTTGTKRKASGSGGGGSGRTAAGNNGSSSSRNNAASSRSSNRPTEIIDLSSDDDDDDDDLPAASTSRPRGPTARSRTSNSTGRSAAASTSRTSAAVNNRDESTPEESSDEERPKRRRGSANTAARRQQGSIGRNASIAVPAESEEVDELDDDSEELPEIPVTSISNRPSGANARPARHEPLSDSSTENSDTEMEVLGGGSRLRRDAPATAQSALRRSSSRAEVVVPPSRSTRSKRDRSSSGIAVVSGRSNRGSAVDLTRNSSFEEHASTSSRLAKGRSTAAQKGKARARDSSEASAANVGGSSASASARKRQTASNTTANARPRERGFEGSLLVGGGFERDDSPFDFGEMQMPPPLRRPTTFSAAPALSTDKARAGPEDKENVEHVEVVKEVAPIVKYVTITKPNDFEEELGCSICYEIMVSPVNLTCGHTFCEACVSPWLDAHNKECPTCREVSKLDPVRSYLADAVIKKHLETVYLALEESGKTAEAKEARKARAKVEKEAETRRKKNATAKARAAAVEAGRVAQAAAAAARLAVIAQTRAGGIGRYGFVYGANGQPVPAPGHAHGNAQHGVGMGPAMHVQPHIAQLIANWPGIVTAAGPGNQINIDAVNLARRAQEMGMSSADLRAMITGM